LFQHGRCGFVAQKCGNSGLKRKHR
jgi:hypothetical protein